MARVKFPPTPVWLGGCIVVCISFVGATLIIHCQGGSMASQEPAASHPGDRAQSTQLMDGLQELPLSFEPNRGQADGQVRFLSRGGRYTLFLTKEGAVLALKKGSGLRSQKSQAGRQFSVVSGQLLVPPFRATRAGLPQQWSAPLGDATDDGQLATDSVLRMKLVGANGRAKVTGLEQQPGKSNYFIGNDRKKWLTNLPNFAKVKWANVYPGVDLVYYGNQRQLEYDFVVQPGGDPRSIELVINWDEHAGRRLEAVSNAGGAQARLIPGQPAIANRPSSIRAPLRIGEHGDLVAKSDDGGEVHFRRPVLYQVESTVFDSKSQSKNSRKLKSVDGHYALRGENRVGFEVAAYDASRPLVIDPVLAYSTYLGGSADEGIFGIAWDPEGNFYVAGETSSPNFPILNALQPTLGGSYDGFVSKFDPTGSKLLYSTYLGGSQFDHCVGVTVDAEGSARVAGLTQSSDFPTFNALQPNFVGTQDAFVARLDPSGSKLVFSTYLGGSEMGDAAGGIALDASGNIYVTGQTFSLAFPVTADAFQKVCDQGFMPGSCFGDAFVSKLNPTGSQLVYSTYLGGEALDFGNDITIDRWGAAYVTGGTASLKFPTRNPFQSGCKIGPPGNFCFDAFVTKFDSTGTQTVYSTYLGGSNPDSGQGIAVDLLGNAYVAGWTQSTDFPTSNPVQPACAGPPQHPCYDAFLAKFSGSGTRLHYSTYLGGSGIDVGLRVTVDALGNAAVTGFTESTNFPVANAIQPVTGGGGVDAFLTEYNPAGSAYLQSTYLGGSGAEFGYGINVDGAGNVWVTGSTSSLNFPLVHPYQGTYAGGPFDAYVSKIALPVPQSIGVLEGEVSNLVVEGILNPGRAQALLIKLQKAQEDVIEGETEDAREELRAFTERVDDYIGKGVLPLPQGGRLRSAALDIISRLGER